jgi:hypothetical protein
VAAPQPRPLERHFRSNEAAKSAEETSPDPLAKGGDGRLQRAPPWRRRAVPPGRSLVRRRAMAGEDLLRPGRPGGHGWRSPPPGSCGRRGTTQGAAPRSAAADGSGVEPHRAAERDWWNRPTPRAMLGVSCMTVPPQRSVLTVWGKSNQLPKPDPALPLMGAVRRDSEGGLSRDQ